jgi:hemerythrin-like domain-containing protein
MVREDAVAFPAAIARAYALPLRREPLRRDAIPIPKEAPMAEMFESADLDETDDDELEGEQDAVSLLSADHAEVKQMFETYKQLVEEDGGDDEKQALAEQICLALTVHADIEEEIFYPAMRESIDDDLALDEAEVEHAAAKDLIAQILAMDPEDALFDAKVLVLGEYVDHHVEEEESEIFPAAEKSGVDLDALGAELAERKQELMTAAEEE